MKVRNRADTDFCKKLLSFLAVVILCVAIVVALQHRHFFSEEIPVGKTENGYTFLQKCETCGKERLTYYDAMLTFVDDDGKMQAMLHWENIIDATGIKMTAALIPSKIENTTDYDSWYAYAGWDLLERLQEKGMDFVNHTYNHANLTKLTEEKIRKDISKSRSALQARGIESNILVYPNNAHNEQVEAVIDDYFDVAFACDGKIITDSISQNYALSRVNINDKEKIKNISFGNQGVVTCKGVKTAQKLRQEMDKAVESKGWLVYMTHAYNSPGGRYYFDEESEKSIIDFCRYVQGLENVKIVTLTEGLAASVSDILEKPTMYIPEESIEPRETLAPGEMAPSQDVVYEKADDPLSLEKIAKIPIANASMTSEELRQICVDYLKLSVSCQWVSDGTYYLTEADNAEQNFTEGKLYGGIPYIHRASGNLYRFMEYYDTETGVLNSEALRAAPELFATACSGTAGWAWSRVVNSAEISWTHSLNAAHGFIPVGPYIYDFDVEEFWEYDENRDKKYFCNTKSVCKKNTDQVMYESYALSHLADCFTRNGHVAMAVSEPIVVRNEDGSINGKKSYIILAEQGQYTSSKSHVRVTADGTKYRIRGSDKKKMTFAELFEAGFLVHTFKEFLGTDPVEAGEVRIYTDGSVEMSNALQNGTLKANYPISDVFTTARNTDGEPVFTHVYRTTDHFTREVAIDMCVPTEKMTRYRDEVHTLEVIVRLSTAEMIPVYSGTVS